MAVYIHEINDLMGFGKYSSKSVADVVNINPSYIVWCLENVDSFALSDDAFGYLCNNFSLPHSKEELLKENNYEKLAQSDAMTEEDCSEPGSDDYASVGRSFPRVGAYGFRRRHSYDSDYDDDDSYDVSYDNRIISAYENEYYDPNLDMDQQSQDFWESF